jgi:uncharacterized membrane protein YfcA
MGKKSLIFLMVFSVSVGPLLAQTPPAPTPPAPSAPATTQADDYLRGRMDGERDAEEAAKKQIGHSIIWFLAGFACGPLGIGGAYIVPPEVPTASLLGKSSQYVLGYTAGYQKKVKAHNIGSAVAGCLVGSLVGILLKLAGYEPIQ